MIECCECGEEKKGSYVVLHEDSTDGYERFKQPYMCYDCQNDSDWDDKE